MSVVVYGVGDTLCTIGIAPAVDDGSPLPFIGFVKKSKLPEDGLNAAIADERAMELIEIIKANNGTIVYFDNPECAENFHKMASIVFTMACQTSWSEREQIKETIN